MRIVIPGQSDEDIAQKKKLRLLFPMGDAESKELLKALQTEYSQTDLSELEKQAVAKALQEAEITQ